MQPWWRSVSWAGVVALAGGLVIAFLAIVSDATPTRSAKLAGLGAIIAAVGARWIWQSLRPDAHR